MEATKYSCPCCGFRTLDERNAFDICPVCFWEDDPIQSEDENFEGGANAMSLKAARLNFLRIGSISADLLDKVRKPMKDE